jgi:endonuclease YncB( thermonuclease family)
MQKFYRPRRKNKRAFFVAVLVMIFALWFENNSAQNSAPGGPNKIGEGQIIEGLVTKVHDGDTFTMRGADGQEIKVRLFGLDAPELKQPYGRESGNYLRKMINRREVRVEAQGYDQYKRLLGLVHWPGREDLAHKMLSEGQTWVYDNYCSIDICARLKAAQTQAKSEGRGLWGQSAPPIAPWVYRRKK